MRAVRSLLFVSALIALTSSTSVADELSPYEIPVLLPLTGFGAFLGTKQVQALHILETVVNARGGLNGQPIRFTIMDDQSSPQLALQLANAQIAKHVPVIMGSSISTMCSAVAPLVEKTGPVSYCYSPVIHGMPGSYVFSSSSGSQDIATVTARFLRERGLHRLALFTATDSTGQGYDIEFPAALRLPENKDVQIVAHEHFNPSDLTVSAQLARIKAAGADAIVTFSTGTPFGTVLRGIHDADLNIPVSASAGNMIYEQMAQYRSFMPAQLYFAGTRGVSPDPGLGKGPIKDAQSIYFAAFKAAHAMPDFASSLVWDPTMIVIEGLRHFGSTASAEQLHGYIEGLHSWGGIYGLYDFRDNSQRGLGQNAMVVYGWDSATNHFVVVSGPGGHVRRGAH